MNVASLELCKELYALSGWGEAYKDTPDFWWRRFEGKTTGSVYFSYAENYDAGRNDPFDGRRPTGITHHIDRVAPAYDLGYLMRKLPPSMARNNFTEYWCVLRVMSVNDYEISYRALADLDKEPPPVIYRMIADTPEDCAAKLAIELFKQGILKHE